VYAARNSGSVWTGFLLRRHFGGVNLPEPGGRQLYHVRGAHRRRVAFGWRAVEGVGSLAWA
jgi:hypothetical protein